MIATIVIILILVVIASLALKGSVSHFKGEGGCCGGGGSDVVTTEPDKILEGKVLGQKLVKIDGMHCENCSNRIKRVINKIDGLSAKVDYNSGEALIEYDRDVDNNIIKMAVENLDYKVLSIEDNRE